MKNPPKDKVKEWNARYYQKTKDNAEFKRQRRESSAKIIQVNSATVLAYKTSNSCRICGESDPIVLEFHHTDPSTKFRGVAKLMSYNTQSLLNEIDKCIVLCANCHNRINAGAVSLES